MKLGIKAIVFGFFCCQASVFASDEGSENLNSSKNWKVEFFNGYINGHSKLSSVNHDDVARVLRDSFEKASALAPEEDKPVVEVIESQVKYFVNLKNQQSIEQEMQKCKEGMKKANSWYVRMAPECLKAKMFVEAFCDESKKRLASGVEA